MHLVQILLPLHDNDDRTFPSVFFTQVREELSERFGGVTEFIRAPAVGLWEESPGGLNKDEVVLFEVLADELDKEWWALYRRQLPAKFRQDEVLIWATNTTKL